MSLNNIQLEPQLMADLYADCLIEDVATTVPEKARKIYLGQNKKKVLVVVSNESVPFLPDNELGFLTSVLTACKLSMADIAIVNSRRIDPGELATFIDTQANTVL